MARPTVRTPEHAAKILTALRLGNTRRNSCDYAGISHDVFQRWEKDDEDFAVQVAQAEAQAENRCVVEIHKAMPHNWQAAAWWLERRRPADYRRTDHLTVDDVTKLSDADLIARTKALFRGTDTKGSNA